MANWPFPDAAEVEKRLDARFPPLASVSLDDTRKNAVTEALAANLSDPANAGKAIAAMRSAIAAIESGGADARLEYLRGAADLQVSKGSGLLAFTAIIAAVAGIVFDKIPDSTVALGFCVGSGCLALLASLLSLIVVWSTAPTTDEFKNASAESAWLTTLLASRGRKSNWAVSLSLVAMVLLVVSSLLAAAPWSKADQTSQEGNSDVAVSAGPNLPDATGDTPMAPATNSGNESKK